jgi:hypothetical protein
MPQAAKPRPQPSSTRGSVPELVPVERSHDDSPVLSPELVLVSSPEDISAALAQLPEQPWRVAPVTQPTLREEFDEAEVHISSPKRTKRRAAGVLALVLIAAGVVGYRFGMRSHDSDNSLAVLRPPAVSQPAQRTSVAPSHRTNARSSASAPPQRPSTKPRTGDTRTRTRSHGTSRPAPPAPTKRRTSTHAQAQAPVRKKTAPQRTIAFVPSRTWAWAPAKDATAYEVTFFRGRQIVFQARPTETRIVLPRAFRFHAGTYRWTVRALPVVAGATPIVDSTFVLTAAGATKANDSAR